MKLFWHFHQFTHDLSVMLLRTGRVSVLLLTILLQHSHAQTSCPCVTTPWTYKGRMKRTRIFYFTSSSQVIPSATAPTPAVPRPTGVRPDWMMTGATPATCPSPSARATCTRPARRPRRPTLSHVPVSRTGNIKERPTATARIQTMEASTGAPLRLMTMATMLPASMPSVPQMSRRVVMLLRKLQIS